MRLLVWKTAVTENSKNVKFQVTTSYTQTNDTQFREKFSIKWVIIFVVLVLPMGKISILNVQIAIKR